MIKIQVTIYGDTLDAACQALGVIEHNVLVLDRKADFNHKGDFSYSYVVTDDTDKEGD